MLWNDVERELASRYRVVRREATWLVVVTGSNTDVTAPVRIEVAKAFDQDWLLVLADVGAANGYSSAELLSRNLRLAIGSFALERDRVVLRASQLLGPLTVTQLVATIEFLAAEASTRRGATHGAAGVFADLYSES